MTDAVKKICKQWISAGYGDEYFWEHWHDCPSEESLTPNQVMAAVDKLEAEIVRLRNLALKAFTVVEWVAGEGFLLPDPHRDADDLLLEMAKVLEVEDSDSARDILLDMEAHNDD